MKFLHWQHAATFASGRLRFGRLGYYRLMERIFDDEWIGDMHEGISVTRFDDVWISRTDQSSRQRIAKLGIDIGEESTARIVCTRSIRMVDTFVLSLCFGYPSEFESQMCSQEDGRPGYDTLVLLTDVNSIVDSLLTSAHIESIGLIRDHFSHVAAGRVTYADNELEFSGGHDAIASSFLKRPKYAGQKEFRIVLTPKAPITPDHVIVELGRPVDGQVIQLRPPLFAHPENPRESLDIAKIVLSDSVDQLRTLRRQALSDEVDVFERQHRRNIGRSYWTLREAGHRSPDLDHLLSVPYFNGGSLTGIIFSLERYVNSLSGFKQA